MRSSVGRLLIGVLLALAFWSGAWAAPQREAATWNVLVGGESDDHALQAQAFLPTSLTINAGDTVNWTMNAAFVHTVTFLAGGPVPPEPIPTGQGNQLMLNPLNAFPTSATTYDGTAFTNSGLLDRKGAAFSLTFPTAGTYGYVCVLHPGMAGRVVVQAAGSAVPMTQAQVAEAGNAELFAKLSAADQLLRDAKATSQANGNGTTTYTVPNGVGGNQASVLRFLPVDLQIKPGDSVSFPVNDPHEIHTVTFYDKNGEVPPFITPQPQASGPPNLVIPYAMPEGGTRVENATTLYNSGIIPPGGTYTFTFPNAGEYMYVCVIHAPQGMFGKIIVGDAAGGGTAGQPGSLPRTGGNDMPLTLLALLGGALLLLGGVARLLWSRRAS
jgi:plastocyanin